MRGQCCSTFNESRMVRMYSKMIMTKSKSYEEQVKMLAEHIKETEASLWEQLQGCRLPQATGTTMNGIRTL